MKINREKTIFDVVYNKQASLDNENIGSKTHKIGIFPKGLVHGFHEKFEILLTLRFMQNKPRKSIWWRSHYKTSLSRQYKHAFKKNAKLAFFQRE